MVDYTHKHDMISTYKFRVYQNNFVHYSFYRSTITIIIWRTGLLHYRREAILMSKLLVAGGGVGVYSRLNRMACGWINF